MVQLHSKKGIAMDQHANHNTSKHIWDLIKDIRFAMLTTRNTNDHLHAWPMTMQNKSLDDGKLWFFMSRSGEAVRELQANPTVGVAFADPGKDTYVSLSSTARLVDNRAKAEELWSKMNDAWFKNGVGDPDLALVEISIIHGHYWNVKESKVTQLVLIAKAALTGEKPNLGESGEVQV
jgi:general stress protein 26